MRRRTLLASTAASTFLVPFGARVVSAAPPPETITPALIEAAKKEGKVSYYTAMDLSVAEPVAKAFEAKYGGIKVAVERTGSERLFNRIAQEAASKIYKVDVANSADAAHFLPWKRQGWLAPFLTVEMVENIPAEQRDPDGMYVNQRTHLSTIAYNTSLVKPEDAPRGFADLLDPKYAGKMVKGHPGYSGTVMTATQQLAQALGWEYFEKLAKQRVLQVQSATEPPKKIEAGERAIAVDGSDYLFWMAKERGAPIQVVHAVEGTPLITNPMAVFKAAPNPNAARLLVAWIMSAEGQQFIVDLSGQYPANKLVKAKAGRPALASIKTFKEDPAEVEKQADEIKARYAKIFKYDRGCMTRAFDLSRPILLAVAALLAVMIVLPVGWLVIYSLSDKAGAATLSNFATLFTDPTFVDPLITTLIIAVSVSLLCCLIAAPLGWLVARTDMPLRRSVRTLVMASLVTPPFVGAIAWEMLAAPNSGLLNQLWRLISGMPADEALLDIYSLQGLIFVIACYTFPYVFILVANALDRMPGELEDASSMLGAKTWDTARRITVPLALPTLLAGALVSFLQAMNLFGSPAILAIPAGFHTLTTRIWSLFQFPPKPELAAAASLPLLILTVLLLRAQATALGRRGYAVLGGKYGEPRLIRLGLLKWPAMALAMIVLAMPLFLPYAALFNSAFSRVASRIVSFETATLHNFRFTFLELSSTMPALKNTFLLATSTATLGALLALLIAYIVARQAVTGHRVLGFLATAPLAIPGIVLGVGLFLAYTRPPLTLYGTLWILLIAFITIELPAAYQQLSSAFHAVHPELEEAGRMLGATRLRTLADITAPLLRSAVIATWCFIFVAVIRELSAAVILFTSDTKVLSVLIFDLKESGDVGAIAVLSLTMVAITTVVVAVANRFAGTRQTSRLAARPVG